jgi:hypothetical protein
VSNLVGHDVRARGGKESGFADGLMEKLEAAAAITSIQIHAFILAQQQLPAVTLPSRVISGASFESLEGGERRLSALPTVAPREIAVCGAAGRSQTPGIAGLTKGALSGWWIWISGSGLGGAFPNKDAI